MPTTEAKTASHHATWLTALHAWTRDASPEFRTLAHIAAMMLIAIEG